MGYLTDNLHQKHLNALADVELLEREYQHICTEEKNLKDRLKVIQKRQQALVNSYRTDGGLIEAKKAEAQTLLQRHNTSKLPKCVIRPEYEQKPTWRIEKPPSQPMPNTSKLLTPNSLLSTNYHDKQTSPCPHRT